MHAGRESPQNQVKICVSLTGGVMTFGDEEEHHLGFRMLLPNGLLIAV